MQQKINCDYESEFWIDFGWVYTCKIRNQDIMNNAEIKLVGNHIGSIANKDVVALMFLNCKTLHIPHVGKLFPNLKLLKIMSSTLKYVKREDFKEYRKVTHLHLNSNEIEFLPADLFADMKQLRDILLSDNKIKMIEPGLLDGLINLEKINLAGNSGINKFCDLVNDDSNATIEEIKQEIRDKFSKKKEDVGISDDLKRIIQNEKLKDFTIIVENTEFKVHKLVLAARSSVLSEMIESNANAVSLKLDNISAKNFRVILNFIYTDELPSSNANFVNLFMAADKLKIQKLKEFAAEKLIEKINAENAFEMIVLANKYEHESLRQKSFEEIIKIFGEEKVDADFAKEPELLKQAVKYKKESDKNLAKMRAILKKN